MSSLDDSEPVVINVNKWVEENKQYFLPPVCNKMMHDRGQMKSFYVGGPNQRKDYHIECGEELFYQKKGDMVLKVVEQNTHRDIHIKEGQMFLLPSRIQHSPQRFSDTVGLVIERERQPYEKDGLRYFVEGDGVPTHDSLFEEWFHCYDLGVQLGPIIKAFFASEQNATGKPIPGTITENPPIILDHEIKLQDPFDLDQWLSDHSRQIDEAGKISLFALEKYQFQVYVFGKGENSGKCSTAETWVWQLRGNSSVCIDGKPHTLDVDDSILIRTDQSYTVRQRSDSRCLVVWQDPTRASTWIPPQ